MELKWYKKYVTGVTPHRIVVLALELNEKRLGIKELVFTENILFCSICYRYGTKKEVFKDWPCQPDDRLDIAFEPPETVERRKKLLAEIFGDESMIRKDHVKRIHRELGIEPPDPPLQEDALHLSCR